MAAAKNKKKKNSQAPMAFVYFLTMLIFLGILGGFAVYLLREFNIIGNTNSNNEVQSTYVSFTNMYARVNAKGSLSDVAVIRFCPTDNKVSIVPISPFSVGASGDNKTFRDIFADGGILKLRKAVEETYGVKVDHYASITPSAFDNCIDIFGGFSYSPPEELYYLDKNSNANDLSLNQGEVVTLSGRQIRLICSYPVFSQGRQGNTEFLGLALKETINNAFRQSGITSDNLDNLYSIITANSETDMTDDIFKLQRTYIRDMLKENITPCEALTPEGTWLDDTHFKVSNEFVESLKTAFIQGSADSGENSESQQEQSN